MSEKDKVRLELLGVELDTVSLVRRRAKEDPLKAIVAAEREMELEAEIEKLKSKGEAA